MSFSRDSQRTSRILSVLLGLFLGRVLGQVVVALFSPSFMPAFEHWQSGALPYPLLLLSQIALITFAIRVIRSVKSANIEDNPSSKKLGKILANLSVFYATVIIVRALFYALSATGITSTLFIPGIIPIPFHLVIASFLLTYGRFLLRHSAQDATCSARYPKATEYKLHKRKSPLLLCILMFAFLNSACSLPAYYIEQKVEFPRIRECSISRREFVVDSSNGITLHGLVFRPEQSEKVPSILIRAPFPDALKVKLMIDGIGRAWAKRGYAVVIQGTRGTLGSNGDSFDLFTHERSDGLATLTWLKQQDFYNGELYSWGGSYFSFTQWAIADHFPSGKGGLASQIGSADFYPAFHPGGSFALESSLFWALRRGWNIPTSRAIDDAASSWPAVDSIKGAAPFLIDWAKNKQQSGYWEKRSAISASQSPVPAQILGAWFDPFLTQQLQDYKELKNSKRPNVAAHTRLIIGPWGHADSKRMPEGFFPRDYRFASIEPALEWFEMIAGRRSEKTIPEVRIFTSGINQWQEEKSWPPPNTKEVPAYLSHQGRANSSRGNGALQFIEPNYDRRFDSLSHDQSNPVPSKGGITLSPRSGMKKQNEIEERSDVLVYTSAILNQDVEVTGTPQLELTIATSTCAADYVAKLVDVFPDGDAYNVSEGILRLDNCEVNKNGIAKHNVTIELQACSRVFFAGHRIRLQIAGSSFPIYDLNPALSRTKTTQQQVFHGRRTNSKLLLPMRPAPKDRK